MSKFTTPDGIPNVPEPLENAELIYQYSHISATSLLTAFDDAKKKRGNLRGVLADKEIDILRAALVMTCAGMDGALKQAIRECLPHLMDRNDSVKREFRKFIGRRVTPPEGTKLLAEALSEEAPRQRLIEEYVGHLTGDSLQSEEQIRKTVAALGVDKVLELDFSRLGDIFRLRNQIIHELDIDLNAPKRKRKVRSQKLLLESADFVLYTTRHILQQLASAL